MIFDGVAHAAASGADVVLADTAGRLHNKSNLMDELAKVRRVADKGAGTVTEVLLVLDATTGQNGLVQARQFTEAVELTGVVLTKLDGSAKGGIVFAIESELGIPVKLVGLGETAVDLVDFDAQEFVDALRWPRSLCSGSASAAPRPSSLRSSARPPPAGERLRHADRLVSSCSKHSATDSTASSSASATVDA